MASPSSIEERWRHAENEAKDLAKATHDFIEGWLDVHPQDSGVPLLIALLSILAGTAMHQPDPIKAAEFAADRLIDVVKKKVQNGRTPVAPVSDMQSADDSKQS